MAPPIAGDLNRTPRRLLIRPRTRLIVALTVLMLCVATVAPLQARVSFVLRVAGNQAILQIDGQHLRTPWPTGIAHTVAPTSAPYARLFRFDGTEDRSRYAITAPGTTPSLYERFLCWLRACSTYDQWIDFSLRDDNSERQLLSSGSGAALAIIPLPARFTLRGALQRPDVHTSLLFTGVGGATVAFILDPDGRSMDLNGVSSFYPHDWRPYLAEVCWTLSHAYLWALALLGLIVALSAILGRVIARIRTLRVSPVPRARARSLYERAAPFLPFALTCAVLTTLLCISAFTYDRLPRTVDGVSYYFEALIMRSGHLFARAPLAAPFFPSPLDVNMAGRWFTHFPPGAPLAIALGLLLHLPWVVEPVLGAASALLLWGQVRRWYGPHTALVALIVLALSPFFLFLAASYMSHMVALFALLLFLEGIDRLAATGRWQWAALAGCGIGYAFLTREVSTVLFAIPVTLFYAVRSAPNLAQHVRTRRLHPRHIMVTAACLALPIATCLVFYLTYNQQLTGHALSTPRVALDPRDTWGFGPGKGLYDLHTPAAGLFIVESELTSLLIHLYGWPYYLTLSFFFIPLATLRLRAHDVLLYGIAAVFLLGYAGYFWHSISFGPRYIFESLPAYIVLTARGVVEAAGLASALLRRVLAPLEARLGAIAGSALMLCALCACNLVSYLPAQFVIYHDYLVQYLARDLSYTQIHPAWLPRSLVLTSDETLYSEVLSPLNDPFLRGRVVYAYTQRSQNLSPLLAAFPNRPLYWISSDGLAVHFGAIHVGPEPREVILRPRSAPGSSQPVWSDLALGPRADLFTARVDTGAIERFTLNGTLLNAFATGMPAGWSFRIQPHGNWIYWLDPSSGAIRRADAQGRRRTRVLTCRCGPGAAFAIEPGDEVVVADPSGGLQRYSSQGVLLARARPLPLSAPNAVAVAAQGTVYIYDAGRHELAAYNPALTYRRVLSLGLSASGALVRLVAAGDWLLISDPAGPWLLAYNLRTGAMHDMGVTPHGMLLPDQPWGLSYDGRRLAIPGTAPASIDLLQAGPMPL